MCLLFTWGRDGARVHIWHFGDGNKPVEGFCPCTYVFVWVCLPVHVYVCFVCVCVHARMYICVSECLCVSVCMSVCPFICVYVWEQVHVHCLYL